MKHIELLKTNGACSDAVKWASRYKTAQAAWKACKRGDWMLWILGKLSGPPGSDSRKAVVLAACECARLALPQYEIAHPNDSRPRGAIETAERHCKGGASLEEVRADAYAAYAATYNADADAAAAYAAYSAACATYNADATYAACATYADAYAAYATCQPARAKRLAECADIVRKHFPKAPTGEKP